MERCAVSFAISLFQIYLNLFHMYTVRMLCKGQIQELNRTRNCWLPAEKSSPFQLCRRCHFHKITDILDQLTQDYSIETLHPNHECLLNDKIFLDELLHPAREQGFLQLLSSLFQHNKIQFIHVLDNLKEKSVFPILMTKRILAHQPGPRCCLYRWCMKDPHIFVTDTLSWNCWSCIAWCLKQRDKRLLDNYVYTFGKNFSRLSYDVFLQTGSRIFIDLAISLHLLQKEHHLRLLIDHMLRRFPLEDVKSFLLTFLQQPVMLFVFYLQKENEYLPLPLRDKVVVDTFRSQIKASIKNRTNLYKEELVMRTWHPRRLFPWCLDIQELADFGYSSTDRIEWDLDF